MHITRQIAMTLSPNLTSSYIAGQIMYDVLDQGRSFSDDARHLGQDILAAESKRGGLKNFSIDMISLPSRLILGVDKQAKNVPPYHHGYVFSDVPKPLPGLVQMTVGMMRGIGSLAGYALGAAASVLGTLIGMTGHHLGIIRAPAEFAASCCAVGTAAGRCLFDVAAWALELLPKGHRKLLNALMA